VRKVLESMPQKRGITVKKVESNQVMPDIYEKWLNSRVEARSISLGDQEEDEVDKAEDVHEKSHRRKRGRGAAASNSR
jgi:hypothetical protein